MSREKEKKRLFEMDKYKDHLTIKEQVEGQIVY